MALRALMLKRDIDLKTVALADLRAKDGEFAEREDKLRASIDEVETQEQRETVEAMVSEFDTERKAHETAKAALCGDIDRLKAELSELEAQEPLAAPRAAENNKERMIAPMYEIKANVRRLPLTQRAFEAAYTREERKAIVKQPDVQNFLAQLRNYGKAQASVTGADLAIPVIFLDLIAENMFRYSKLLNRVRVRTVRGEGRQTIAGTVPEAVWTEACAALNEVNFVFNQITTQDYKVGAFVPVCNSTLYDTDSELDLVGWLVEMMSESIGLAKDKAILYGNGIRMPLGICPRLAQTSKPADYPANAPAWVDLHTTNVKSISADLTGAAFWAALTVATGNTFTKYSRGRQFWAMNSKTYNLLKSKAITFTASGDVVANVFGILPIVNGDIDVLEFIPDGDIIGGYGDLYLWAQREGAVIGTDVNGYTLRVTDNTLFYAKERADGMPIIPGAFVAINIAGSTPTTSMTFAGDTANDATLQGLTVGALTLDPTFDADKVTYTANATNATASAAVTAIPAQPGAQVSITVTHSTTIKNVINGGSASLAVGDNVIAVTVKQGNATRVYTVTVTRAAS